MSTVRLGARDLLRTRMAHDVVWETAASIGSVVEPRHRHVHRHVRARAATSADLAALRELFQVPGWIPDSLAPVPSGRRQDPQEALRQVAATDEAVVVSDLRVLRRAVPRSPWSTLEPARFAAQLAARLVGYWVEVLAPAWESIAAIAAADLTSRADAMVRSGLGSVLADLGPGAAFDGAALRLDTRHQVDVDVDGRELVLTPTVFRWDRPCLAAYDDHTIGVGYPALGAGRVGVGLGAHAAAASGLETLLGRTRAEVLRHLRVPGTTTELSVRLELAMATVNAHLTTLAAAGLAAPTRHGRSVVYTRTSLGDSLVEGGATTRGPHGSARPEATGVRRRRVHAGGPSTPGRVSG